MASFLMVTAFVLATLFASGAASSARADAYMGMTLDCGSNGSICTTKTPVRAFFSDSLGQQRANSAGLNYGLATWFPAGVPIALTPICYDVYADDPSALNLARRVAANVCFQPELSCPNNSGSCIGGTQAWKNPITFSSTVPYSAGRHSISIRRLWVPFALTNPSWDYVSTIYFDVQQHADLTAAAGTPQSAQVLQPFAAPLQVLVKDQAGQPLPNTLVTFTKAYAPPYYAMANLSSMTATTNSQGIASVTATANGYGGSYAIIATNAGASAPVTFALTNAGSPSNMQIVGGAAQSTPMLAAFPDPLQVRVTDNAGNPTSGVPVTFTPQSGPPNYAAIALLSSQTVNTDNNGIASVTASANGYSGFHTVIATADGVNESPVFTLSNHGEGSQIYVHGGNNQAAQFLNSFAAPLDVLVTDDVGTPASGVRVDFTTQYLPPNYAANAILGSATAITDSTGVARISASANGYSGDHAVIATIHGTAAFTTFSLRNHGAANKFGPATGTPQSARVLASFARPLQVLVTDDVGSPASGTVVTFAAPSSGASVSLSQQTVTTGPDGKATVTAIANGQPGAFAVTASIPGAVTPFSFALTNLPPDPSVTSITPASGAVSGGTAVTISGAGFTGATAATIGGAAVTGLVVVDDTTITATSPAGTVGTASVVVTNPVGSNAANTLYSYVKSPQVVAFATLAPTAAVVGGSYTPAVTGGGSTAPVVIAVSGPCTMAGGVVTFDAVGDCSITADQPGDSNYTAAAQVQQVITVRKLEQILAFATAAPTPAFVGQSYTPIATGGASTAPVVIAVSGACAMAGGVVTFDAVGQCIITADQAGDTGHDAATQVQQVIAVAKAPQVVAFVTPVPTDAVVGGSYTPAATGGASALPVVITASGACSMAGGIVTFDAPGACTLIADQAGDTTYAAAPPVQQAFDIMAANARPTADAGLAQTVNAKESVVLDGSKSTDPDAGALTYSWTQSAGKSVTLIGATSATPSFVAPSLAVGDADQTLVFALVVTDSGGLVSQPSTVTITVIAPNAAADVQISVNVKADEALPADDKTTAVITVFLIDSNGNQLPFGSNTVTATTDLGTLQPAPERTFRSLRASPDGGYAFILRSATPGVATVSVIVDGTKTAAVRVAFATIALPSISGETQGRIAGFMLWRADDLATNQPGLARFLTGSGCGFINAKAADGTGHYDGCFVRGNSWVEITSSRSDTGSYSLGTVGTHRMINPDLLLGVMLQFDGAKDTASQATGTGWMLGPYFAAQLNGQPFFIEGRLLYGQSQNRIDALGLYTDPFATTRVLAQLKATGAYELPKVTLRPNLALSYALDRQLAYVDSLLNTIPGQKVSLLQIDAGLDFGMALPVQTGQMELTGGLSGIYSAPTAATAGDMRARAHLGLRYDSGKGTNITFGGFDDGLGTGTQSYGANLSFQMAF